MLLPYFRFPFTNYFTSNAMSSACSAWRSSAATEHDTKPLLQSTTIVNIIFINIDWKRSRHDNPTCTNKNLGVLAETTSSIVTNMKPAVICCCEVGTAMSPMTVDEMSVIVQAMREAWEEAATEHPAISFHFEDDAPYLTIWDANLCKCTHERILENVYNVPGHRRKAQAFLCTMPGDTDEEGIDVVNVHAPSGTLKLTDVQRFQLMKNLLQSSSRTKANRSIGEGRFLIGGDMNSKEITLNRILDELKSQDILKTSAETMLPLNAKHGDICVVGGFTPRLVDPRKARNHDPQHVPYGITWRKPLHRTRQQLTSRPTPPTPDTTTTSRPTPPTTPPPPPTPDTTTTSRPTVQTEVAATRHATEQSYPQAQIPATPDTTTESRAILQTEIAATRHATEQSHPHEHEVPELNEPGQEMAYVIVNAFLDNVTFKSTEAEKLIKQVILRTGEGIQPHMRANIDEVFLPIFFYYPNGLHDRTIAEPRNAGQFIKQWHDIAEWRRIASADITQHATEQLPKFQRDKILHEYIRDFIANEAYARQKAQSWTKNKSSAEAVLRKRCGSVLMAKAIWQTGLPDISEARFAMEEGLPATEQQQASIEKATETILKWLSMLANSIQEHKAAPEYQEHARKSGTQKNTSGLTEIELKQKEEKKHAARLKHGRHPSTASSSNRWQAPAQWQWPDDTWQAHAQWQWQAHAQWQSQDDTWQASPHWH